jgi:cytochrome c biogenesis protein
MNTVKLFNKTWNLLCSLKLAIILASAATLVTIGGSLLVPSNPGILGVMDRMVLSKWLTTIGVKNPDLSWWVFAAVILILLLGINTLCCFADWLFHLRTRWRKTGEYFIHLGFVLILSAYLWGSLTGFRSEGNRFLVGEITAVNPMPGYYLRLEAFEPLLNKVGRPIDMINTLALLKGETVVARKIVKINSPLTYGGLSVLPASFGTIIEGFYFFMPGKGVIPLVEGNSLNCGASGELRILNFYHHAERLPDGRVALRGENLANPAMELELIRPDNTSLREWYFLKEKMPSALAEAGIRLWPTEPLYRLYSILTVNNDPGAPVAMAGAMIMLAGVLLTLGSFYYKRTREDHPDVA